MLDAGYLAYLDLLKRSLCDFLYDQDAGSNQADHTMTNLQTGQKTVFSNYEDLKREGLIDSKVCHSLIGLKRMDQLQQALITLEKENVVGDVMETGVLRGGACIFMRGILKALNNTRRQVWVADSFRGFPPAQLTERGIADPVGFNAQAASLDTVKQTFERYRLLDEQVRFLPGYFEDTLPTYLSEVHPPLALLRLDSDFYPSTRYVLEKLYPRISEGGFIVVDDYYIFEECRRAVREYRQSQGIKSPLQRIDAAAVYWRKGPHKIT